MGRIQTAVLTLPTLSVQGTSPDLQGKSTITDLRSCLEDGYHITLMNDFEYQGILWTHYVLEKEVNSVPEPTERKTFLGVAYD